MKNRDGPARNLVIIRHHAPSSPDQEAIHGIRDIWAKGLLTRFRGQSRAGVGTIGATDANTTAGTKGAWKI